MKRQIACKILLCLAINIAIACIAIFIFGTYLYQDDDNILSWMTYGIITEASSRTYYTNVILGWLYKHLFSWFPRFNWQTLVYYVGMVFAGTVGLYAVLKKKSKVLLVLWLLFELVFFNDVYVYLTFSVVSAYVAYQGYLVLFLEIKEKEKSFCLYIMSGLILAFSSMVRIDSFLGASGFAFFVWLIMIIVDIRESLDTKEIIRSYVYPFVAIIGACFLLYGLDRLTYTKDEWKAYKDYETVRLVLTDYRNSASLMRFDELEEVGINETVTRAVAEWRNNDPEVLTKETLEVMASTGDQYNYLTSPYVWSDYLAQFGNIGTDFIEVYFSLFVLIYIICSIWKRGKNLSKWLPMGLLLPMLGEFFYFAYIGRIDGGAFPERCIYIVLMGLAVSAIILCGVMEKENNNQSKLSKFLMTLIVISAVAVQPTKDYEVRGLGLVDTAAIEKEYGFLGNNNKVYICEYDARTFLENSYGAWQVPPAGFMDHTIELGSWLVNHPMQNKHKSSLGCENPYRALYENDDVYYIRLYGTEQFVLEYLQKNYDDRISCEYVKPKGEFKVFKYVLEE